MGIIKRQAISGTIITYIGVAIGFITTALIFPRVLTKEEIGLLSLLISYSVIFAQFASLGTGRMVIIAFPYFKSREHNHHGILFILAVITAIGFVLTAIGFYYLREFIISTSKENSRLLVEYFNYLLPLTLATLIFLVLDSYYKALQNAVKGIILKEFVQRLLFLIFIIFYYFGYINFGQYVVFYVASISLPALILVIALIRDREFNLKPDLKFIHKDLSRMMFQVSLFGIISGFSGMVITNIDRIMVERFMDLGATGIYTTTAYFATLVIMPSRALLKISDPIISQSWKNNDLEHLRFLYKRTSMSQLVVGALLFIGIWGNEENIFRILPDTFEQGKYVIFFIGLAFLSDMGSGASSLILANSKHFKYQAYFMILLIALVIVTNIIFIPLYGLTGAALATLISKLITNFVTFLFLKVRFNLQPYSLDYFWVILFATIAYFLGYILPESENLYLDILYRSAVITAAYLLLLIRFRIFNELNEKVYSLLQKTGISRKK